MEERCGATISPQHPLYRNGTTSKDIVMQELTNFVVNKKQNERRKRAKSQIGEKIKIFVRTFFVFYCKPYRTKSLNLECPPS